jgi:hypothetical protein
MPILIPHPTTPAPWLDSLEVELLPQVDWGLALCYRLRGDLHRLRLPPPAPRQATDGLWRHTCCEVFLQGADAPAYREFNFSPSGAWAAYRFQTYREGGSNLDLADPGIVCRRLDEEWQLHATLPPWAVARGPGRMGLSVIIEDRDGAQACFALHHPVARPDFHHPDSFVLELA